MDGFAFVVHNKLVISMGLGQKSASTPKTIPKMYSYPLMRNKHGEKFGFFPQQVSVNVLLVE